jgi:hypothetical protein
MMTAEYTGGDVAFVAVSLDSVRDTGIVAGNVADATWLEQKHDESRPMTSFLNFRRARNPATAPLAISSINLSPSNFSQDVERLQDQAGMSDHISLVVQSGALRRSKRSAYP